MLVEVAFSVVTVYKSHLRLKSNFYFNRADCVAKCVHYTRSLNDTVIARKSFILRKVIWRNGVQDDIGIWNPCHISRAIEQLVPMELC